MGALTSQFKKNQIKSIKIDDENIDSNNNMSSNVKLKMVLPYNTPETPILSDKTNIEITTLRKESIKDNDIKVTEAYLVEIIPNKENDDTPSTKKDNHTSDSNQNQTYNHMNNSTNNNKENNTNFYTDHLTNSSDTPIKCDNRNIPEDIKNEQQNSIPEKQSYFNDNTCTLEDVSDYEYDDDEDMMIHEENRIQINSKNDIIRTNIEDTKHDGNSHAQKDSIDKIRRNMDDESSEVLNVSINVGDVDVEDLE